ncbi:MAG: heme ABC exporter ATP-binding protein CcmA [Acetobacteraceae bacterium]
MLCAEQITVTRDGLPVLLRVGFSAGPAHALRVSGPNGAGKSTLLRVVSGLRRPDGGRVTWQSEDITHDFHAHALRVAYLGHRDGLKLDLSPRENLAIHRHHARFDVTEALTRLNLPQCADVPVRQLSAGQRRRVALAALVMKHAPIWLLDEPHLGLDATALLRLGEITRDHLREGGIAIITTHAELPTPFTHILTLPERPASWVTD